MGIESEERVPLLSGFFKSSTNKKNFNEPNVKFSLLRAEINYVLSIYKALQLREKSAFQLQAKLSRNSVWKKRAKITSASVGTVGASFAGLMVGWTFFGIRDQQSLATWNGWREKYVEERGAAMDAWFGESIPGADNTCWNEYGALNWCTDIELQKEFCQSICEQYTIAWKQVAEWNNSSRPFDGLQVFLVIFSVIATIALIAFTISAVWYRNNFLNLPTIPAPKSNNKHLDLMHDMSAV